MAVRDVYDEPTKAGENFDRQQDKPVKALIGIALLVVLAVILARMNPVAHEISSDPGMTTSQTTGATTR